ncbi:MAG TPA: cysteine hydrolase [Nitrososphaerales archaeon]|nr:cysteine hydrolase [Nitrososphaerales archaeon]
MTESWTASYITEEISELIRRPTALLIVDMQNDFISEDGKIASAYGLKSLQQIVPRIRRISDQFRLVRYPVFFTRMVYRRDYSDAGKRSRSRLLGALQEGSWGAEIVRELRPKKGDYLINKQRASSFYQTNLDMILKNLKVETLVITGVATNVCVESTARDALFRDYDCVILSDCVATKDPQIQRASLRFMNEFTSVVTTSSHLAKCIAKLSESVRPEGS